MDISISCATLKMCTQECLIIMWVCRFITTCVWYSYFMPGKGVKSCCFGLTVFSAPFAQRNEDLLHTRVISFFVFNRYRVIYSLFSKTRNIKTLIQSVL